MFILDNGARVVIPRTEMTYPGHSMKLHQNAADAETFHAIPLLGRNNELLAVLLLGSSRRDVVLLTRHILQIAGVVAGAALLIGLLVSLWVSSRITRPLEELAELLHLLPAAGFAVPGDKNIHVP